MPLAAAFVQFACSITNISKAELLRLFILMLLSSASEEIKHPNIHFMPGLKRGDKE